MQKNPKWLSEEALQIAEKRREAKGKGEKETYPFEWRFLKKLNIELPKEYWEDGGGIGRGDHFLFYKFIERTTER